MPPLDTRPQPPALKLKTPLGTTTAVSAEGGRPPHPRLPPLQIANSATSGSSETSDRSRSGSFGERDTQSNQPTSATSSISALNFISAKDPLSAISGSAGGGGGSPGGAAMERENSLGLLPDLEKLSLEKGRALDVEDLDDAGWKAASREDKIVEIGRLGEGAGGAVTQCVLRGGKTVFALKVSCFARVMFCA